MVSSHPSNPFNINDRYETSWRLQVLKGDTWTEVVSGPPSNSDFSGNTRYIGKRLPVFRACNYLLYPHSHDTPSPSGVQCLLPGKYKFTIFDKAKDGLCCEKGQGKYTAFVDGIMRFSSPLSSTTWAKRVHLFTIFPPPTSRPNPTQFDNGSSVQNMSDRDKEWLDSHNNKRQLWHTRHNKAFVPLSWDSSLKAESKVWAEHLLSSCGKGMWHDPNNSYGENIASNSGTGSWAARRTTDDVVARFVDREEGKLYPENLHLTQVINTPVVYYCTSLMICSFSLATRLLLHRCCGDQPNTSDALRLQRKWRTVVFAILKCADMLVQVSRDLLLMTLKQYYLYSLLYWLYACSFKATVT